MAQTQIALSLKRDFRPYLLTALIVVGVLILAREAWDYTRSPSVHFSRAWKEDLAILKHHNRLPSAFDHLARIEIRAGDAAADQILKAATVPIQHSASGTFALDMLVTTWQFQSKWGVIIQYDLINDHGNTIWEGGRTLTLKGRPPTRIVAIREDTPAHGKAQK